MQDRTTVVHSNVPDPYDFFTDLDPDPTRLPAVVNKNNLSNITLLKKSSHKGKNILMVTKGLKKYLRQVVLRIIHLVT
jgi:hypothetical protein